MNTQWNVILSFINAALNISLRKLWKCNVLWFYLFGQGVPNETKGTINLKTDFILSFCSKNHTNIWAAMWQNQQNECAPSEDSDQPGHQPSLTRVFAVRSMGSLRPKVSSCGQRRLWSAWASDLSLCWAHTHFVGFVMSRLILVFGTLRNLSIYFATDSRQYIWQNSF